MKDFFTGEIISPNSKRRLLLVNFRKEDGILKCDKAHTLYIHKTMPVIGLGTKKEIEDLTGATVKNITIETIGDRIIYYFYTNYHKNNFYFPHTTAAAFTSREVYNEIKHRELIPRVKSLSGWFDNYSSNIPPCSNDNIIKNNGLDKKYPFLTEGIGYTFGVEIETSEGYVPQYMWNNDNIICMRDGSITGKEYVAGPFRGDQGFYRLQQILTTIAARCKINKKCSIHVHIGGFEMSKSNIVAIYLLCKSIETELYKIVPPTRKENPFCRQIPTLHSKDITGMSYDILVYYYYDTIFKAYYGDEAPGKNANKQKTHKRGPKCGYDHSSARYCWLNLIPAITKCHETDEFDIGSHTVEIRFHEGTLNYDNVENWIMMWMGIIKYAINNASKIIINKSFKTSISEILKESYPKTFRYLLSYVNNRKIAYASMTDDAFKTEQASYIKKKLLPEKTITELIKQRRCVK